MSNDYYTHGSYPATGASGSSAAMRAELDLITLGFGKLPALTGNGGKAVIVNGGATALDVTTGTLTLGANFTLSGSNVVLAAAAPVTVNLPGVSGLTLATLTGTETLTNKSLTNPTISGTATSGVTGTGAVVLGTSPSLTTPTIGGVATTGVTGTGNVVLATGPTISGATLGGTFTGTIASASTGTTQSANDNSTKMATTAYVDTAVGAISTAPTGTLVDYIGTSAPTGWVLASGRTIGSAASAATERANADTATLYALLWNSLSDTEAPVSGGRGASAAADFAANKTIALPDLRGRAVFGKDDMGGSAASRVTNGNSGITGTTLGASGGDERTASHTHAAGTLATASDGAHTHTGGVSLAASDGQAGGSYSVWNSANTGSSGAHTHTISGSTASTGSGSSANMPPAFVANKIIKL